VSTMMLTPAGGVERASRPETTPLDGSRVRVRYDVAVAGHVFGVPVPARPPAELLLDVEVKVEAGIVCLTALDLDVAVEGRSYPEAFIELISAVEDWLEYLRDETPKLTSEIEAQPRYVGLLGYAPGTWFK